tara:strand:+ start:81 stop:419 length:339 start_codon:yes stop_codon:yes gene_type:complete
MFLAAQTVGWMLHAISSPQQLGDLHLVSIAQLKTVIDQCDITFCTADVDRHSAFITRTSGHHIAPHEIEIKPKNDDRPAGVCPDVSGVICTIAIMPALNGWNIGKFVMQVRY